jgi:V/A-type H+-transporting ATPase subunit K
MADRTRKGGRASLYRKLYTGLFFLNLVILVVAVSSLMTAVYGAEVQQPDQAVPAGDKFIGAGLAVAGSTIGAGIALYGTASSGFAAIVEKSELTTWLLLIAGLSEGVAIYGLIIAIMILGG